MFPPTRHGIRHEPSTAILVHPQCQRSESAHTNSPAVDAALIWFHIDALVACPPHITLPVGLHSSPNPSPRPRDRLADQRGYAILDPVGAMSAPPQE